MESLTERSSQLQVAKKQAESDIKDAQMNFSQNNKKQGGEKSKSATRRRQALSTAV